MSRRLGLSVLSVSSPSCSACFLLCLLPPPCAQAATRLGVCSLARQLASEERLGAGMEPELSTSPFGSIVSVASWAPAGVAGDICGDTQRGDASHHLRDYTQMPII
ncbi:unnamed protein product [Prorocentrum cordatum]|uniref:Secreted protein n=1 Tax=Prorocentrum cordatum TaxID=2364126 RepID=A0ABN9RQB4_9DINO|nr:unnamed protein product [Polarella glacialis]